VERHPGSSAAASPRPQTNPFQAPDFGADETFLLEEADDAEEPVLGMP
jgi:hypothetical protein